MPSPGWRRDRVVAGLKEPVDRGERMCAQCVRAFSEKVIAALMMSSIASRCVSVSFNRLVNALISWRAMANRSSKSRSVLSISLSSIVIHSYTATVASSDPADRRLQSTLLSPRSPRIGGGQAAPRERHPHRLEQDAEIQPERHVLEVEEVVPDLLHLLLEGVRVPIADLRPTGDPRPDRAPERVVRDRVARHLAQVADHQGYKPEIRHRVGPRTHEVHFAPEDVDELWQLVQPEPPQPLPDARDSVAVVPLPLGSRPTDRVHGAELDQLEGPSEQSHALLDEEHRSPRVQLDHEQDQTEQGHQHDQPDDRYEEAERTRERAVEARHSEVAREDDAAWPERLERELPGQSLVHLDGVLDQHPTRPRLEEGMERQSPPEIGERDDDAIGPGGFEDTTEIRRVIQDADDDVSAMRPLLDLLDDLARQRARPEDQHARAATAKAPNAVTHAPPEQEANDDDEARHERDPVERRFGDEAVDEAHPAHERRRQPRCPFRDRSIRLTAKSHRIGPSLSGPCRTTGPDSRRSARTITGGSPGRTKSASTGLAPSAAYRAWLLDESGVALTTT